MSRGWESKDVESQMEEAALRRAAPDKLRRRPKNSVSGASARVWNYRESECSTIWKPPLNRGAGSNWSPRSIISNASSLR